MKFIQIIKKNFSIKKLNYILIALIIILCLANIIVLIKDTVDFVIIQETVTRQPESFTELYFENHNELPTEIGYAVGSASSTDKLYEFSFTIKNFENKDMTYDYKVSLIEHEETIINEKSIRIPINTQKTITERFILPGEHSRTKVTVELINKKQQISFWMKENIFINPNNLLNEN